MTRIPVSADGRLARRVTVRPAECAVRSVSLPTVSVVIPCHNYAEYLPDAVHSVLSQSGVVVDVVIVDDASTDDSQAVALALAEVDDRVRVVTHRTNRGAVQTYNTGLGHVTGEFTVRLDADDMLTPGSLRRSTVLARRFPSVGLVYGHPVHFVEDRFAGHAAPGWGGAVTVAPGMAPPFRDAVTRWALWPGAEWLAERCRTGLNVITSPEVLMRSSVVAVTGGQRDLPHTHDMEMWMRVACSSDVAYIEGADQAWHREHPRSLSGEVSSPLDQIRGRLAAFDTLFGGLDDSVDNRRLHDAARTALARAALREASHELDRGRATEASTDELVDFARSVPVDVTGLREYRALRVRRALHGYWPVHRSPFVAAAVIKRLQLERSHLRWKRSGR